MEIIIITGMSGAGKSEVLNIMEDLGYFSMDNLPPELLPKFAEIAKSSPVDKVAAVVDLRSGEFFKNFSSSLEVLRSLNVTYKIVFLEASEGVIIKRYKERRRPHPLDKSIVAGYRKEKSLLEEIRKRSDYIIDSSNKKTSELKFEITNLFKTRKSDFTVSVVSFGFKNGILKDADIVFDVRFLPNPFYIEELKEFSGEEKPVKDFVMKWEVTQKFIDKCVDMLDFLIPNYKKEGKTIIVVAFGCTGGFHRSVAIANEVGKRLSDLGHSVEVSHRDKV